MSVTSLCREKSLHYRDGLQCYCAMLVLFGAKEAGCFGEVAALHSGCLGQVSPITCTLVSFHHFTASSKILEAQQRQIDEMRQVHLICV